MWITAGVCNARRLTIDGQVAVINIMRKTNQPDFGRFLAALGAAAIIVTALGLYFIHRITSRPPSMPQIDFSKALKETIIKAEAPVSPNTARIFFTTDGRYLSAEAMELPRDLDAHARLSRIMERLLSGPTSRYFEPILPDGTSRRGMYLLNDKVVIDFSKEISTNLHDGVVAEMLALYSVVNSVTLNIPEIRQVQFLIEGEERATLDGEVDISAPLGANLNLIKW